MVARWNTTQVKLTIDTQANAAENTQEKDAPTPPVKTSPVNAPPPTDAPQENAKPKNKTPARNAAKVVATLAALLKPGPRTPERVTKATQPNVCVKPQLKDMPDKEPEPELASVEPPSNKAPPNKPEHTRNVPPPRHPAKEPPVAPAKDTVTTQAKSMVVVQANNTSVDQPKEPTVMPPLTVVNSAMKMVPAGQAKVTDPSTPSPTDLKHESFSCFSEFECPARVKTTFFVPQLFEI
jgi:hypothetical protein